MRKALLLVPMTALLLLCACGGKEGEDPFQALQERFQSVTFVQTEAALTCNYQEEVRTYELMCSYTPERSRVEVKAPETVESIKECQAVLSAGYSYSNMIAFLNHLVFIHSFSRIT